MKMSDKARLGVIYARVSTEEQGEEGYSIDLQIESCRKYCELYNIEVIKVFREVKSGRKLKNRPELMNAIAYVENNMADILVAWKLDRIIRSSIEFADIVRRIGYNFATVMENLDGSTTMGRFAIDMIVRIAQLESEQIGDRVRPAMRAAKRAGKQIGWVKGKRRIEQWKVDRIIKDYKEQGITYQNARELGVSVATIYNVLRDAGLMK